MSLTSAAPTSKMRIIVSDYQRRLTNDTFLEWGLNIRTIGLSISWHLQYSRLLVCGVMYDAAAPWLCIPCCAISICTGKIGIHPTLLWNGMASSRLSLFGWVDGSVGLRRGGVINSGRLGIIRTRCSFFRDDGHDCSCPKVKNSFKCTRGAIERHYDVVWSLSREGGRI